MRDAQSALVCDNISGVMDDINDFMLAMTARPSSAKPSPAMKSGIMSVGRIKYAKDASIINLSLGWTVGDLNILYSNTTAELLLEDLPIAEAPVVPWSHDHVTAYGISDEECNYSYDATDAIERILTEQNDVQAYHKGNGNNES